MDMVSSQPIDRAGAETLEIMSAAPRYNAWQYSRIAPYLGQRVCEIGAGIGNLSALMLEERRELAVLTDIDPYYRGILHERFAARPEVRVEPLTLPDPVAARHLRDYRLDTAFALNVVEHIEDDIGALRSIATMLEPGGRAVILVPAFQALYGSLDRDLGHFRRYTRRSLARVMQAAGFRMERTFYFNAVGCLGWWWNGRVRRIDRIPVGQLRSFDSLVPLLRVEDAIPLPAGQSVIGIGSLPS